MGEEGREGVADVALDDKVCDVAQIGRLAIDDHQRRAAALGQQRQPGRRPDHQRGADRQEQVAVPAQIFRALHGGRRHRLAERHRRGLDVAAAFAIGRMPAGALELLAHPGQFIAPVARKTGRVGRVAVQLDDIGGVDAGCLVQVVDILRHQSRHLAGAVEARQRAMAAAGPGGGKARLHGEAPPPGLVAHLPAAKEVVELDRPVFAPQPAGRAEIRDAAFGRDAGAGERHDPARGGDQLAQAVDGAVEIGGDHRYNVRRAVPRASPFEVSTMRYLHTMLRVRNLDDALDFYVNKLGLKETRRRVDEKNKYTLVFLAAPGDLGRVEETKKEGRPGLEVELTYNWDSEDYGEARYFGHLAYEVDDIYATCERLMQAGVTINRPPRDGVMAFVRSPDRHSIELLQKGAAKPPQEPWKSMPNTGKW